MRNPFKGIRFKIVLICIFSVLLTAGTIYILRELIRTLVFVYPNRLLPLSVVERILNAHVGFPVIPSLACAVCFVAYFTLLSRGTVQYLRDVTNVVNELANGNLDEQIRVQSKDELGELAGNINRMARRLKSVLEEERLAVQAKNDLITNVSHDLRTPLTSIIGYLRLIDEDRYRDEVQLRYYVNIAYEKAQRLVLMVNDLFEFTRLNHGQMILQKSDINLVDLMGQLAADFSIQLAQANVEIQVSLLEDKITLHADGDKLVRAFENLLSNAIKYGSDGRVIRIAVSSDQRAATVRIVNYGVPIPSYDLPHIFERFYRVDKSRSHETGGSGLGLAIVKSIVELHGGSIAVSSDEQETAFTVILPLQFGAPIV